MTTSGSEREKTCTRARNDEFAKLWKLLPHPSGSVVRIFSRNGDHRNGDYARTAAELRKYAKAHSGDNVYVAPNPTCSTKGMRHTAEDVTAWSFFLVDVDPVHEKVNDPSRAMDRVLDALSAWTGFDLRRTAENPPIIISSGRGEQAWIRLADIPLDGSGPVTRSVARRVNGYWLKRLNDYLEMMHGCKIDSSVSDLPRVMRLPGSVNMKTGKTATILCGSSHVFHGLAEKLTEGTPASSITDPPAPEGLKKGQRWQKVFHHMTRTAQEYLTLGQEEPGRHKVLWHTAKKLAELGVTRDEARRALRRANTLKGKDAELPADQIEHALDTAFTVELPE